MADIICDPEQKHCGSCPGCVLNAKVSNSRLIDGLCAVKVKKEKTPSGWEQPYVSLKIGNFEFKRLYQTEDGAKRCADKIKTLLTTGA